MKKKKYQKILKRLSKIHKKKELSKATIFSGAKHIHTQLVKPEL